MIMKRRVLVAEDNLFLGEIMRKELAALTYDVTVVIKPFTSWELDAALKKVLNKQTM
jgi:hypothetical protein